MRKVSPITFGCAWRNNIGVLACELPATHYVSGLEALGDAQERVFCEEHAGIMAARS